MTLRFETTPIAPAVRLDVSRRLRTADRRPDPALREAFVAHGPAGANLERLFTEGALCITTGQQPGLLTGPLFTIYKALSAITLASALEAALERTVVPVFWVAGDDHDFQEANHFNLLTMDHEIEQVLLRSRAPEAPSLPLYREPLGAEIAEVLETVGRATPETEFRQDVFDWLNRHYRPEQDLASAFADALAELLGPRGLVVLRTTHPAAKGAMAPHLLRLLEGAGAMDRSLSARAAALAEAGQAVPVTVGHGTTPVLLEDEAGRDRLVVDGSGFRTRRAKRAWSLADVRSLAETEPERLSPNVLSRPAIEAALLPTLAYVAGPAELQYLPQADPIYEALEIVPQRPVARWSARFIEARVAKVLDRYGIGAEELAGPEGRLEASLVRNEMPDEARTALDALRGSLAQEYERLEQAAIAVDPTLGKAAQSARNSALAGVGGLEKRLVAHLKKKNEIVVQQIAKARRSLFPRGKPQERVYNTVPYLVRYGPAFLDGALEACRSAAPELESPPHDR
jgi:bacillithiol biosynthesis cysteine-adding enzyme BshC